jgi:hypothetical protein
LEGGTHLEDFILPYGSPRVGKTLVALNLPKDSLIALIGRGDRFLVPDGGTVLEAGDVLWVLGERGQPVPGPGHLDRERGRGLGRARYADRSLKRQDETFEGRQSRDPRRFFFPRAGGRRRKSQALIKGEGARVGAGDVDRKPGVAPLPGLADSPPQEAGPDALPAFLGGDGQDAQVEEPGRRRGKEGTDPAAPPQRPRGGPGGQKRKEIAARASLENRVPRGVVKGRHAHRGPALFDHVEVDVAVPAPPREEFPMEERRALAGEEKVRDLARRFVDPGDQEARVRRTGGPDPRPFGPD